MQPKIATLRSRGIPRALRIALCVSLLMGLGDAAEAKVFLTRLEALQVAFPECEVDRQTHFLTNEQKNEAQERAGVEISSALAYSYQATCDGEAAGTAYFDSHRVRTLPETVMIVIDPEFRVVKIEIVEFSEPEDYIPVSRWYAQFQGRQLDRELQLKRAIRGVTGATLTARATTDATRRVLAIHQVLTSKATTPSSEKKP